MIRTKEERALRKDDMVKFLSSETHCHHSQGKDGKVPNGSRPNVGPGTCHYKFCGMPIFNRLVYGNRRCKTQTEDTEGHRSRLRLRNSSTKGPDFVE